MFDNLKLAAYLDEAGDDPAQACAVLAKNKIHYVVIRSVWGNNICDTNDQACSRLRQLLLDHQLSPIAIVSDLGRTHASLLPQVPKEKIDRLFNLASYFQAGMVRVCCGARPKAADEPVVAYWANLIADRCLSANLIPLYEIDDDSPYREPVDVVSFLTKFRKWRLLYDPVQLIVRQNQNPFTRYWTLLKAQTAAVDVRDYKVGFGFKPVGLGDAKIKLTVQDGINHSFKGWFFFEASLGRKFAGTTKREETFQLAIDAFRDLVNS